MYINILRERFKFRDEGDEWINQYPVELKHLSSPPTILPFTFALTKWDTANGQGCG